MLIPARSFANIICLENKGLATKRLICLIAAHNFYVNRVAQVFHGFAEDRVVHKFVKVLFKVPCCVFPEFCIHPDVRLHPAFLFELQHPVYAFQFHALLQIKLQVSVMHDIVVLV